MSRKISIAVVLGLAFSMCYEVAAQTRSRVRTVNGRGDTTLAILRQRIPEISFEEAPLEQVIDWLEETTQLNVVVRWDTLEANGVERDRPVSLRARNLRLAQVLWLIMNQVGGTDLKLAYRASGKLLVISTHEDLGKEMITKVYDIADLLVQVPRFTNAAQLDPAQALQGATQGAQQGGGAGGGGGGGGGGGQLFQGGQGGGNTEGANPQDDIEQLISLITETIEPDSWVAGGGVGSVRAFQNLLVVHNTILVHQLLAGHVAEGE